MMYEHNKTNNLLSFAEVGGRGNLKEKRRPKGRGRKSSDDDSPRKKKMKNSPEFSESILPVHPSDVLDMPVDPNEPTYCLCHQVSYGEMIGCDNPDCPIEWFHFACVDLTTKPKGKWYVTLFMRNRLYLCFKHGKTMFLFFFVSFFQVLSTMHPGSKEKMRCTFVTLRDYISI
ncbi:inhibitor of growth 5-like protein [Labeo rohita]|uniref:Inhibitor of growth 5-like protein n=1 Tax=Labeo rohita TaxID=84645 RepID=A0A498P408_LABRO|nr:inhibitor of growth 5-like protein [Labeo rohita]